ncbi:MAG: HEAT repeat domain-containing protein [Planctomycetes bacterium]|nr:HEAT repeat domain-containing protein [Planctomycetota bacterium]
MSWVTRFPMHERVMLLLVLGIALLLAFSAFFAVSTVVLRIRNDLKRKRWAKREARWQPILLDVLAGEREPDALWACVGAGDHLYFIDYLMRYARRLRGEERMVLSRLAGPYLKDVAKRLRRGDVEQRARAAETLGTLDLQTYAAEVVGALKDPSPLVAMVAARALARREHPQFVVAVLDQLHRFDNWSTSFLASMLAAVGPDASPHLRGMLPDRGVPVRVRVVAAETLARLHDVGAADGAARLLAEEGDRDLLAAALRLLGQVGRPVHVPPVRVLCASPDFVVRSCAVEILGQLGTPEDASLLGAAMDDPSLWVARHAARALQKIGGDGALEALAASNHPRAALAREVLAQD